MKRVEFEISVKNPLPYISALLACASFFFAAFLIVPEPDIDIVHTVNLENVTYTYDLIFRYSEGIRFYCAAYLLSYAALAVLCFIPSAKRKPLVFAVPLALDIVGIAAYQSELRGTNIIGVISAGVLTVMFILTAAGIIRIKYIAGALYMAYTLMYIPIFFEGMSVMSLCDVIPVFAFAAAYALICFSFAKNLRSDRLWNTPSDKYPTKER